MKKINLEQAITMGLLLSSSMYNVADAQEIIEEGIELNKSKQKYVKNLTQQDLTISGKGILIDNNSEEEYKIELTDIGTLSINKDNFTTDSAISLNGKLYTVLKAKSINIENIAKQQDLTAIKINTNNKDDKNYKAEVHLESDDFVIKNYDKAITTNVGTDLNIQSQTNRIIAETDNAIDNQSGNINLLAKSTNTISAIEKNATAIKNQNGSIKLESINNEISAGDKEAKGLFYDAIAINNKSTNAQKSTVDVFGKNSNQIFGAVIAEGAAAKIRLAGSEETGSLTGARSTIIRSSYEKNDIVSAMIAKEQGAIELVAGASTDNRNYIEVITKAIDDKIKVIVANSANIKITGYDNAIYAGRRADGIAVENEGTDSTIKIYAQKDNVISGAIEAIGNGNNIEIVANEGEVVGRTGYTSDEVSAEGTNNIISSAIIKTHTGEAVMAVNVKDNAKLSILSGNKSGQNYIKAEDKYNGGLNTEIAVNAEVANVDISANSNIIVTGKNEKDGRGIALKAINSRIETTAEASNILAGAIIAEQNSIINFSSKSPLENKDERNRLNQIVSKYNYKTDKDDIIVGIIARDDSRLKILGKENLISVNSNDQKAKISVWVDDSNLDIDGKRNTITSGTDGVGKALLAEHQAQIKLFADTSNIIEGSIIADKSSNIDLKAKLNSVNSTNYIQSVEQGNKNNIVSAIHTADEKSQINLQGDSNVITTAVIYDNDKEYAIWAEQGTINIDGKTTIVTTNGSAQKPNNIAIAMLAGMNEQTSANKGTKAVINGKLHSQSYIYGDILADKNGSINLSADRNTKGVYVEGNILAGNGGTLSLDLGNNSTFVGRTDSYSDKLNNTEHGKTVFAPEFAQEIVSAGKIDLKLGNNSRWNVTGQSWVDNLEVGNKTIIDMTGANTENHISGDALTINNFKGNATINMHTDIAQKKSSDMLYIKSGEGNLDIVFDKPIDANALAADGLRFATIGQGANINVTSASVINAGTHDIKYQVSKDDYKTDDKQNIAYNGSTLDEQKTGNSTVDGFFDNKSTMSANTDEVKASNLLISGSGKIDTPPKSLMIGTKEAEPITPFMLMKVDEANINNIGKTIINLSQANYNNAIYMDSMNNKRGEARYLENNEGFWVRMSHVSIGKSAFEINNNIYQLGYDKLHEGTKGQRRTGVVVDYMTGNTTYKDISATGKVSRKGLWFYNTWIGDDGHYSDLVAKWGHLENDFRLNISDQSIDGEYTNDVFSISSEYGYKKALGKDWYIEPQIQLQYAYITGADYHTSQDTNVQAKDLNSLITRAGFRIGKEIENKTTVYIKTDIVHEFLGDLDMYTMDNTGSINDTFENRGTWYNVGLGVATLLKDNTYAYVSYERSFGNDNTNTYQVNGGVRWAF